MTVEEKAYNYASKVVKNRLTASEVAAHYGRGYIEGQEDMKRLCWHHGSERPLPATGKKIIVYYKDSDGVHHAHTSFLNSLYEWFGVPESVGDNLMWCYPPKED